MNLPKHVSVNCVGLSVIRGQDGVMPRTLQTLQLQKHRASCTCHSHATEIPLHNELPHMLHHLFIVSFAETPHTKNVVNMLPTWWVFLIPEATPCSAARPSPAITQHTTLHTTSPYTYVQRSTGRSSSAPCMKISCPNLLDVSMCFPAAFLRPLLFGVHSEMIYSAWSNSSPSRGRPIFCS